MLAGLYGCIRIRLQTKKAFDEWVELMLHDRKVALPLDALEEQLLFVDPVEGEQKSHESFNSIALQLAESWKQLLTYHGCIAV
jgi:hypothetical protein